MLKVAVLVSGGGTNLQAIIDAVNEGKITNAEISLVISNNKNAYALERAAKAGIPNLCISPKNYASRAEFNQELLKAVDGFGADLVVLAGFLVVIPEIMPGIMAGALIAFTMSIDDFVISYFTAGNGVTNLSIEIYSMAKRGIRPTVNALATIMVSLVLVSVLISNNLSIRKKKEV